MLKHFFLIATIWAIVLVPQAAIQAYDLDDASGRLDEVRGQLGSSVQTDLPQLVGTIIAAALSLVGLIFLVLMVYAGYLWMISRGNEDQAKKARDIIVAAVIGLVVVLSAYAITFFVTTRLGAQ